MRTDLLLAAKYEVGIRAGESFKRFLDTVKLHDFIASIMNIRILKQTREFLLFERQVSNKPLHQGVLLYAIVEINSIRPIIIESSC